MVDKSQEDNEYPTTTGPNPVLIDGEENDRTADDINVNISDNGNDPDSDQPIYEQEIKKNQEGYNDLDYFFKNFILANRKDAKNIFICGKRGYGKTFDTNVLSNRFIDSGFRVHSVLPISGKISGCPHTTVNSGEVPLETAYRHALDDVTIHKIKSVLVIDEVDQFCSSHKIEESLKKILNYGRHLNIWCVCNARRPAAVNREITSLMDAIIVHYVSSEIEYKYIQGLTDDEFIDKCRDVFEDMDEKIKADKMYKYHREVYVG